MKENLDFKLKMIILAINELTTNTKRISINAGITASKMSTNEGKAFKIIAEEIRKLSDNATIELKNLETALADVRSLYSIINIAGRQRMLSQKIMKLKLLRANGHGDESSVDVELKKTVSLFEDSLVTLANFAINTQQINVLLLGANDTWSNFKGSIDSEDFSQAIHLNEKLLYEMNEITLAYEGLSG